MTLSVETLLVVTLALAVFSAITALGGSLVFGIGYERLSSGFEIVRKQTAYFSDAIFKLEKRVSEHDKKIASVGGAGAERAESLVRHAEDMLNELNHLAQRMQNGDIDAPDEGEEEDVREMPALRVEKPATIVISAREAAQPAALACTSFWGDNTAEQSAPRGVTLM